MSDWRLNGQERYLYGVKLKHMNIKDKMGRISFSIKDAM